MYSLTLQISKPTTVTLTSVDAFQLIFDTYESRLYITNPQELIKLMYIAKRLDNNIEVEEFDTPTSTQVVIWHSKADIIFSLTQGVDGTSFARHTVGSFMYDRLLGKLDDSLKGGY